MAAWEICLQDGGNAAFLRVYPQDGGVWVQNEYEHENCRKQSEKTIRVN